MMGHGSEGAGGARTDVRIALAVSVGALCSRLIFLAASPDRSWPHSVWYEGDAVVWAHWASAIAAGRAGEFNSGLPFYPPAAAYLIAALGPAGLGVPFTGLKVLWCVLSAAACGAASLAIARTLGRRAAVIAGVWLVFSFALDVLAISLNTETPYLLLLSLLVLGTLRMATRPGLVLACGLGMLHGLASLTRAEHPLLAAMLCAYLVLRWRPWSSGRVPEAGWARGAAAIGVMGAVCLAACLPWSIHATRANIRYNTTVAFRPDYNAMTPPWSADARAMFDALPEFSKRWLGAYLYTMARERGFDEVTAERLRALLLEDFGYIPEPVRTTTLVASSGPLAFALASHPGAGGGFSKAGLDARFGPDPAIELALPTHLRLYNRGWEVGWEQIRRDPGAWARNAGLKVLNFWSGVTLGLTSRNVPLGRAGERRPVDMVTHLPGTGAWWRALVTALVLAGVATAMARRRGGIWLVVIAYKVIVTVLFFGYARQGASILPAFLAFGALTIDAGAGVLDRAGWRRAAARAGALVVLALAAVDASVLVSGGVVRPIGPVRGAPAWGPGAFECVERITIEVVARGSPPRAAIGSSGPSAEEPRGTRP